MNSLCFCVCDDVKTDFIQFGSNCFARAAKIQRHLELFASFVALNWQDVGIAELFLSWSTAMLHPVSLNAIVYTTQTVFFIEAISES